MKSVISADGTTIGFSLTGTGSPLVLVHGGAGDHTRWDPLIEHLQDHFTVCAMDRRGRGLSGDGPSYSFDREVEDVIAVASVIDGPVHLYAVSSGANYTLEAAPHVPNLQNLVLYEPAFNDEGEEITPAPIVDKIQELVDAGKREEAIVTTLRDVVHLSDEDIEAYRSQPSWPARLESAHTVPREMRDQNTYVFEPSRFASFNTPTLLLTGSESPAFLRDSVDSVHSALSNSRVRILEGQGHGADIIAPQLVAGALIEFMLEE